MSRIDMKSHATEISHKPCDWVADHSSDHLTDLKLPRVALHVYHTRALVAYSARRHTQTCDVHTRHARTCAHSCPDETHRARHIREAPAVEVRAHAPVERRAREQHRARLRSVKALLRLAGRDVHEAPVCGLHRPAKIPVRTSEPCTSTEVSMSARACGHAHAHRLKFVRTHVPSSCTSPPPPRSRPREMTPWPLDNTFTLSLMTCAGSSRCPPSQ